MKAVIFAGGKGERLKPLTNNIPKALVSLNNVPMVERIVGILEKSDIDEVIILTSYKGEEIEGYFRNKKFKIKVICIKQYTKNDFEAFSSLRNMIKGNFILIKCDVVVKPNVLIKFIQSVKKNQHDLVVCVTKNINDCTSNRHMTLFF